jgi:putative acetyltransferase
MQMSISIRAETPEDRLAVAHVHRLAFGRDDEARLVDQLRDGGWARVSLVAEFDGRVVGHVLFSELAIVGDARRVAGLALAPLAVLPEVQSRGVGSELVRRGLEECRRAGHAIVLVVGHPSYYPRFGFSAELARPLETPYAGDSFMALELVPGALRAVRGHVEYPPPFGEF